MVRMDRRNDAAENLGILTKTVPGYCKKEISKRGESKEDWIAKVKNAVRKSAVPVMEKTVTLVLHGKNRRITDAEGRIKNHYHAHCI